MNTHETSATAAAWCAETYGPAHAPVGRWRPWDCAALVTAVTANPETRLYSLDAPWPLLGRALTTERVSCLKRAPSSRRRPWDFFFRSFASRPRRVRSTSIKRSKCAKIADPLALIIVAPTATCPSPWTTARMGCRTSSVSAGAIVALLNAVGRRGTGVQTGAPMSWIARQRQRPRLLMASAPPTQAARVGSNAARSLKHARAPSARRDQSRRAQRVLARVFLRRLSCKD